jgi:NAD(P)H-hydrate epimerase
VRRIPEVPRIPRLDRSVHKGDRGRVLLVAGSIGMSGAARLAGWGALRGGAGLVTIAVPDVAQPFVAQDLPCAMTVPLPSRKGAFAATGVNAARAAAESADAIGVGPGMTRQVGPFLRRFLKDLTAPMVLDADALNLIAEQPDTLAGKKAPIVLTPHPGEAARLLGHKIPSDLKGRLGAAEELADKFGAVVVLKGAGTVVTDGDRYYINRTGNPGMACGGAGDVLTGLVAARLAWRMEPLDAAMQAVHAHGRAGDLASAAVGESSMIATDLVANLPAAMGELTAPSPHRSNRSGSRRRG